MSMNIDVMPLNKGKVKPDSWESLGFCQCFTDRIFQMKYSQDDGWTDAKIMSFDDAVKVDLNSTVLHYGQGIFEGLKAFKQANGDTAIFRLDSHLDRMKRSARRMAMPNIDIETLAEGIKQLVQLEKDWVPDSPGCALYIRPMMFANDTTLGVRSSSGYVLSVLLSPVSRYYSNDKGISIVVEETYSRTAPGGTGDVKAIGNYASSLMSSNRAKELGFDQVLWLDACEHEYIEEVGTMNIFFVIDGVLVTPELSGTIMPGITRDTLLKLAMDLDIKIEERKISISELAELSESGKLDECFGSGTAVSISPVIKISWREKEIMPKCEGLGVIGGRLLSELHDMQYGVEPDRYGWVERLV